MFKNIQEYLASSLGRQDEAPNIELGQKIAKANDAAAVQDLFRLLDNKATAVRSDVIKVIYEVAERNADLIIPFTSKIIDLLDHKDNRLKWGAMSALSAISLTRPEKLTKHIPRIVKAMDEGTVITRDNGIVILAQMGKIKKFHSDAMELLLEQIEKAPVNQVPMYAEKMVEAISLPFHQKLERILLSRKDVWEIPSKQKRL